jgi:hypothetical protein
MDATLTAAHPPPAFAARDAAAPRADRAAAPSRRAVLAGRVLSGIAVLFLTFDAAMKVLQLGPAVEGTVRVGYPASAVFGLGVVELVCLAAYLLPRTSVLGAVLWTGWLGGAVATHVRLQDPLFTHVLAPIYVAALVWLGLWLREPRLRALVPLRRAR